MDCRVFAWHTSRIGHNTAPQVSLYLPVSHSNANANQNVVVLNEG